MSDNKITLDQLNELYVKAYRALGIPVVYSILKNYKLSEKSEIVKHHAVIIICSQYGIKDLHELTTSKKRGTRISALIALYLVFIKNSFEFNEYMEFTKMPYNKCYKIMRESNSLDAKVKPNAKFLSEIDKLDNELKDFIKNINKD